MANITRQNVGRYTYLYESISFRDEQGRPRNRKTKIGKIDPMTGEPIYTQEYLERLPELASAAKSKSESTEHWTRQHVEQFLDSVKTFGTSWFLQEAAKKTGLWSVLQRAFPSIWKEIFTLASYLIVSDKPVMYCEDWISETEWLDVGNMSSQRVRWCTSAGVALPINRLK